MSESYFLKITHGSNVKEYSLDRPVTAIGRSTDNMIILDDEQASRRHAEVEWAGGRPRITDLGSSNGTLLNGVRINPNIPYPLKAGDSIAIGSHVLTVRAVPVADKIATPAAAVSPVSYTSRQPAAPVKKSGLLGGKSLVLITGGVIVVAAIILAVLLVPGGTNNAVIDESEKCITEMNTQAMDELDSKIDGTEQKLSTVEEDLVMLDNVVKPCLEWIEIQKAAALQKPKRSSWQFALDNEGKEKLKNNRYRVTTLKFEVLNVGLPEQEFNQVIEVAESTASDSSGRDYKLIEAELNKQKEALEETRATLSQKREDALSAIQKVHEYWGQCEVKKINSTTFTLSGEGLGWSKGFTDGKWTFYRDRNDIVPADNASKDLKALLVPET